MPSTSDGISWQGRLDIYPEQVLCRNVEWDRQVVGLGSISQAELSQNETEQSINTSAANSLLCPNAFVRLANEAQSLWESSFRSQGAWSNCSSICSSASTLASTTSNAFTPHSYPPAYSPAPSFDFTRSQEHTCVCNYEALCTPDAHKPPSELGSLSVGPGLVVAPLMPWQRAPTQRFEARETTRMDEIEEFSLGPGCPF